MCLLVSLLAIRKSNAMYYDYVAYRIMKFIRAYRENAGGIVFGKRRERKKQHKDEWVTLSAYILKPYDFIVRRLLHSERNDS